MLTYTLTSPHVNKILFYRDQKGNSPIEAFLDNLNSKQALKVTWVLNLIEEHNNIPHRRTQQYTSDIF